MLSISALLAVVATAAPDVVGKPVSAAATLAPFVMGKPLSGAATALPTLPGQVVPMPTDLQSLYSQAYKTPLAAQHPWLTHTFAALFVISALSLLVLLAVQTTKQEGLSGTLGGRVESAYRPRLGFDQQLQRITTIVAVSFVLFGLIVSLSGI